MNDHDTDVSLEPAELPNLTADPPPPGRRRNLDLILDIPVQVTVELGQARLKVEDLLGLYAGAVIPLDRRAGDPVDVLVNGKLIARGEVVVIDDTFGIRISSITAPAQRIRSLEDTR